MKLRDLIKFSTDFMSPGAAHAPIVRHGAVATKRMNKLRQRKGPNQALALAPGLRADASSSDLASHKTWQEPSASDLTIRNWRAKRVQEKVLRRNMDPFEIGASKEVTGPCGCTLKLGDRVVVEDVGRGKIKERNERMLRVKLDSGKYRTIDQKFVHRMASA